MKFGLCGSMVAKEPDLTGIEVIEQLKEIGYDYIELSLAHLAVMSEEGFEKIRERIKKTGLSCESCNNFFPSDLRLTGENIDPVKIECYVETAMKRAKLVGASIIVFGSGQAKKVPEGFPREKAWQQLVDLLKVVSIIADKYRITIAVEHLRKEECNIINSIKEAFMLSKAVGRDNIKVLIDYYHMSCEKEDLRSIAEAGSFIRHVHFARAQGRTFPKNWEEENYEAFFESLAKIGYNERISVEAYSENFCKDALETLNFLKTVAKKYSTGGQPYGIKGNY